MSRYEPTADFRSSPQMVGELSCCLIRQASPCLPPPPSSTDSHEGTVQRCPFTTRFQPIREPLRDELVLRVWRVYSSLRFSEIITKRTAHSTDIELIPREFSTQITFRSAIDVNGFSFYNTRCSFRFLVVPSSLHNVTLLWFLSFPGLLFGDEKKNIGDCLNCVTVFDTWGPFLEIKSTIAVL